MQHDKQGHIARRSASRLLPGILVCLSAANQLQAAEITPLAGYRTGGEVVNTATQTRQSADNSNLIGIIIGSEPFEAGKRYELYYSHQSTDIRSINTSSSTATNPDLPLTIDYLHIGGTAPITQDDRLETFVSGGFGFSYLSPDLAGLDSELRASASLGIGFKWPLSDSIAMRVESRLLATLFNNNSAIFCSNGSCSFSVSGNYFTQYEVFAGITFSF